MVQHRAILTMADQWKVVYDLSKGAIFNDLEQPLPPVSRSRYALTLNISETVRDTDIVSSPLSRRVSRDRCPVIGSPPQSLLGD